MWFKKKFKRTEKQETMRVVSGSVNCNRLETFLYILMRDYVPSGYIENIFNENLSEDIEQFNMTNGWLASHAKDIAKRLTSTSIPSCPNCKGIDVSRPIVNNHCLSCGHYFQ